MTAYTVPFEKLGRHDVDTVGGKNSSLGEMISHLANLGVSVPNGFATTAQAYRDFLEHEGLAERISKELATLDVDDVEKLAEVGAKIRQWVLSTPFPGATRTGSAGVIRTHERRSRRSRLRCALPPPPKTCPTPRSPASRKHSSTCAARKRC